MALVLWLVGVFSFPFAGEIVLELWFGSEACCRVGGFAFPGLWLSGQPITERRKHL